MSLPKEGSRDVDYGIIVSMVPDVCMTPQGFIDSPVPYTIWCRQGDAANLANSVRQTDDRSHAVASILVRCYGDEPGTGGGVLSGTTGAECTPKTWSQTVRAEGRNMVRHTDEWWMNHWNTYGRLIYTKDLNEYASISPEQISPQIRQVLNRGITASVTQPSQLHQVSGAQASNSFTSLSTADLPTVAKPLQNAHGHGTKNDFIRISAACNRQIGTYRSIKKFCETEENDHHIVPDFTMGGKEACRKNNTCRIPNMPTYGEMPAICLTGNPNIKNSEHAIVQSMINYQISSSGQIVTLRTVIDESKKITKERVKNLSAACMEDIDKAVDDAFKGKDLDQVVRANPNRVDDEALEYLNNDGNGRFTPPVGGTVPAKPWPAK